MPELEPFDPKKHEPIDTVGGMKSTEYLASEESPEGTAWNIPTIWFDKKTKEPVLRTGDDAWNAAFDYEKETGKKFPRYKNIREAVDAAEKRSSKGGATKEKLDMAEGGSVEEQTEEALGYAAEGKKFADNFGEVNNVSFKDAATFVAEMTPIVGDAMAAKEVYDELQKDEPNYYLAGALGGAALIGLFPGVGDVAAKAIRKGAREVFDTAKRVDVDTSSMGSGLGNVSLKPKEPKTSIKAYKLFTKGEDGKLYPLFVDADTEVPVGQYLKATFPEYRFTAANGNSYVPSRGTKGAKGTGDMIKIPDQETRDMLISAGFLPKASKAKSIRSVAARPGWHAGDNPTAAHIGPEVKIDGKTYKIRGNNQVWAEVEMPADVDWQEIANSRASMKKDGTPNVKTAQITDELPVDGYYRYKTNPNMEGNWLISGSMKVLRELDRDEVLKLNKKSGVKDLPTLQELKKNGYYKGGTVMDDYQYAETMQEPVSQTVQAFAIGGLAQEGGIADDGMSRDPVSGNEIPPGSLAEEVRDDVPAQLSEGEYVVPADVVRFFGVRVFEEMRMEAKMGLQQMEQNGRIGGEPATATAPPPSDDLSPAEEQLLQEIMAMEQAPQQQGMAEGGVVNAAYGISVGEGDGLTEDITVSTGGPAGGGSDSGMREVFFIHPDGRRIKVLLLNDTPIGKVPEDFDTFVTDTPENRVEIDFKDTTGETGSGVGTASGVDSRGGSGDAVPGATGRNSVAVGETYTKPNGESATRMPDEYYMAGGQSDENRRNQEFFDSIGEEAPEKTIEDTGINYADPTAGATDALSAGKNELMQLGAGLFPLLGVINSGVQAKAISKANANAIIALRKGDTEAHAAIIKQIETYQNVHSSVLADAGTWFAGLFVDAGQNRVDDFEEITGKTSVDGLYPTTGEGYDEGFKRVDVAPTSSPLNEEQKEKRLEALKEEYEKNKAKEEASKSREQKRAEKERKAAEAERVKQQKIVREKRQREVSEANRIKEGVKLAADAAAAQAAAYQAAVAANNDNDKGGGSGLGSANNSGLGYAAVTGFGKADGPGGQGFVNRAYAAEGGLVSRPKKKKK